MNKSNGICRIGAYNLKITEASISNLKLISKKFFNMHTRKVIIDGYIAFMYVLEFLGGILEISKSSRKILKHFIIS